MFGINNHGQMVGYYSGGNSFLLDSGLFSNVNFPGACNGSAQGINDAGEIVGWYSVGRYCNATSGYSRTGLSFPLKGAKQGQVLKTLPSPYTALINAVFDHAMTHPYTPPNKQDDTVTAFTDETGQQTISVKSGTSCYGQAGA